MKGSLLTTLLPLVLLLVVMYFLLIRPQKKREKEVNAMRSGVQVGDEIITIGGICGKIVKTKDESLVIQVGADKVKFEIMRWAVSKVVEEGKNHSAKNKAAEVEDVADEEKETKKSKPKRMRKITPADDAAEKSVEEIPAEEPAEAEKKEAEEKNED